MKFDTVIIGGGLSGLTSGIRLAEEGRKCAIVSTGQSAIHFFSGSLDLLGSVGGREVENPLEVIPSLPSHHPYRRIGAEHISRLALEAQALLGRAGLCFQGTAERNHHVLTPMGTIRPTWLTLDDFTRFDGKGLPWKRAAILNFAGFLDFHSLFIKDGLAKFGVDASIGTITMEQFAAIRRNPSEMRSSNIAKVLDQPGIIDECAGRVNGLSRDVEVVILPAVFGLFRGDGVARLREKVDKPLVLLPALPPSVPGIRTQVLLKKRFQDLGGTYFLGDRVEMGRFAGTRLVEITTSNHGDISLAAPHFILASGSFYSKGIIADPDAIREPVFGLDIDGASERSKWFDARVFNDQPFMHFWVMTDERLCGVRGCKPVENLLVAGSVLGGTNPLKEGSGAGICLLTSLFAAEQILA